MKKLTQAVRVYVYLPRSTDRLTFNAFFFFFLFFFSYTMYSKRTSGVFISVSRVRTLDDGGSTWITEGHGENTNGEGNKVDTPDGTRRR